MTTPHREQGSAPLREYSGIGDGRSVALVALDGSVDWWPLPDLDSKPVFAALLDPSDGGRIWLRPTGDYTVERRYVGDTNVIETVFTTATGTVRLTDSLNTGVAGRLPWNELARKVEGLAGEVAMAWEVAAGSALGTLAPWVRLTDRGPILQVDDQTIGLRLDGVGEPQLERRTLTGTFTTSEGSRSLLAVVGTADGPLHLPETEAVYRRIDRTIASWADWSDIFAWDGPWPDEVKRSALTLKLLLHSPTGSIAAAATTSLPEKVGGDKNWDYRYTWVRDTGYTLDAFVRCQLKEEVHAAVSWLLATIRRSGLRPFYCLDGTVPQGSTERDVPGWRGSRPVVDGNDAADQLQLGCYGDLFQIVTLCVQDSHVLDVATQRLLSDLADRCCDEWQMRDAGMWELQDEQHYTMSKISCWQALDRAVKLTEAGQLQGDGARWRAEAERIREWVERECWSEGRQSYVMCAGSESLDAGVLLAARFGFDTGPRMRSTITALLEELGRGTLLHRYTGMDKDEGAFIACSFWAVEALALTGQRDRAITFMDELLETLGDTTLLAEMIDPDSGELLGNIPQALSHLALINAASAVQETGSAAQETG